MRGTTSDSGERLADDAAAQTTESERRSVIERLRGESDEGWRVAGVSLYIVVAPGTPPMALGDTPADAPGGDPAPAAVPFAPQEFWSGPRRIDDRVLYQMAVPAQGGETAKRTGDPPLAVDREFPLHDLPQLLASLFAEAYARQPQLRAGGAQYVIAHIRRLIPPTAWVAIQARRAKAERRAGQVFSWEEEKIPRVVQLYMRGAVDLFDATPVGSPRGYYNHYDAHTHETGRIAFGRYAAVLGGLSGQTLTTFVSLLQSGELARSGGLTLTTFVPTMSLIAQWSNNQDVRENIEQVAELKRSGDAATTGQIWVSYALAVIGVALAFIAYLRAPALLAPGLALLGVSCVVFAWHAQSARRVVWQIGAALFSLGILALIVGFAADAAKLPLPFPLP